MLRFVLFFAFLLSFGLASAQPEFRWSNLAGSPNFNDEALDMATDAAGNRYVVGFFAENFTYDATVNTLSTGNNLVAAFVVKFDTAGTVLWQRSLGNNNNPALTGAARAHGIAVSPAGDVVVVGFCSGTIAQNGVDTAQLTNTSNEMFVWRLNTDGTTVWLKATDANPGDASSQVVGRKVDLGANGDIYIGGDYFGSNLTVNLDVNDPTNPDANFTGIGNEEVFVGRYDSNGNLISVQRALGSEQELLLDLDYTSADGGKVAIAGYTTNAGDVNFATGNVNANLNFTSQGTRAGFHVVYNADLTFAYGLDVENANGNTIATGVHFDDNDGELWAGGTAFGNGATNYGGTDGSTPVGNTNEDPYLLRIATDGTIKFINEYQSPLGDRGLGLDVDAAGNAYFSGWVRDTLDMGDGFQYISNGNTDAFMMVVDPTGATTFGVGYGGGAAERATNITVDPFGHVATIGSNEGNFSIDGTQVGHLGERDAYIAFFRNPNPIDPVSRVELNDAELAIYPNPASDRLSIRSTQTLLAASITLTDLTGRSVQRWSALDIHANQAQQLNLSALQTGLYLLRIESAAGSTTQRIVVE